jgi:DNA invertase Pin-like site-specific DNA recombinase
MPDRPAVDTIGYIRVSTEQQAGEDRSSLPEQRRALTERAVHLGRVLHPAAVFEDPGASGATAEGRPGFMAMLAYCEQHVRPAAAPGAVLVLNDSRFGRFDDPEEATHWRFVLKKLGWIVRFAEGDDVEDGIARGVLRFIGSAQASEYRANLKRTARRAARATAAEGRWQNRAPFGYRRLATRSDGFQRVLEAGQRKASDEVVRLTLGPESEQELIRLIFTTYASGQRTLGGLSQYLAERHPERLWSKGVLNAVIKNPAYAGDVVWCRRPHDAAERRATRVRDRSEWVVVPDAHPAIISRELFHAARARLDNNKVERRMTVGGYPLSGLVHCAQCGQPFMGGGGRRGPADDPDRFRFYRDRGGVSDRPGVAPACHGPVATLRKRWLEAVVVRKIAEVVSNPKVQQIIGEEIDRALDEAQGGHAERRVVLEAELVELQRRRSRIVASIGSGVLTEREATATLAELRAKIGATEAELERTRFAVRRTAGMAALRDRLLILAADFETQAFRAVGPALRELIRPWLSRATLNKDTRMLTLQIGMLPEILGMESPRLVAQDGRVHNTGLVVTRRIKVPANPAAANAGRRRRA